METGYGIYGDEFWNTGVNFTEYLQDAYLDNGPLSSIAHNFLLTCPIIL